MMTDLESDLPSEESKIHVSQGMLDAGSWALNHSCTEDVAVTSYSLEMVYTAMERKRISEQSQK